MTTVSKTQKRKTAKLAKYIFRILKENQFPCPENWTIIQQELLKPELSEDARTWCKLVLNIPYGTGNIPQERKDDYAELLKQALKIRYPRHAKNDAHLG